MKFDPGAVFSTILKLAVISFVVGFVLVQLDVTPEDIFDNFGQTLRNIYEMVKGAIEWSAGYIVIGAVLVVPIWGIAALLGAMKRRRSDHRD